MSSHDLAQTTIPPSLGCENDSPFKAQFSQNITKSYVVQSQSHPCLCLTKDKCDLKIPSAATSSCETMPTNKMATSEAGAGSRAKSTAHTTSRDTLTERKSHDSLNAKHGSDLDVPHLADETDEIDKVLNCLRDMTTSQSRSFPDEKPREYQLSKESWFKFSTDPFVESCREE